MQAYFIIGSPNETREDIQKTIDFIEEENIEPSIMVATPFQGSDLWNFSEDHNLIPEKIEFFTKELLTNKIRFSNIYTC